MKSVPALPIIIGIIVVAAMSLQLSAVPVQSDYGTRIVYAADASPDIAPF